MCTKSSPCGKVSPVFAHKPYRQKGKWQKRCQLVNPPTSASPRLVSGIYHPSHNDTAAFPNTILLFSETGSVHVFPLTGLPMEGYPGAGAFPASWLPDVSPVRHPAAAPSRALACISRAVYGQIFHFSFITPACTVT